MVAQIDWLEGNPSSQHQAALGVQGPCSWEGPHSLVIFPGQDPGQATPSSGESTFGFWPWQLKPTQDAPTEVLGVGGGNCQSSALDHPVCGCGWRAQVAGRIVKGRRCKSLTPPTRCHLSPSGNRDGDFLTGLPYPSRPVQASHDSKQAFFFNLSATNWHLPRALPMTEQQRHLPSASMKIEHHAPKAVELQQSLREFRVEWGTLCSRQSGGTGL